MPEYVIKVTTEEVIPVSDFEYIEDEVAYIIADGMDPANEVTVKVEYA